MTLFFHRHTWARILLALFGIVLVPFILFAILFGSLWLAIWDYVFDRIEE